MNLSEYLKRKDGVPLGHPDSLRNNLQKSLGAKNFSTFWNVWNPSKILEVEFPRVFKILKFV